MRFATVFAVAAALVTVTAAPHRNWDNNQHGHGKHRGGNKHVQPIADAPESQDDMEEVEDCSPEDIPTSDATQNQPGSDSATTTSSAESSSTPSPSASADQWWNGDALNKQPSEHKVEGQQDDQQNNQQGDQQEGKQDDQKDGQKSDPKDNKQGAEQVGQQGGDQGSQQGGGSVDTSGGGKHGQSTTYGVTNPAENHGLPAGTVACQGNTKKPTYDNSDFIAAVPEAIFNQGLCGKMVKVKGDQGEAEVEIVDSCAGDGCRDFDLSHSAMIAIHGKADDVVNIEYWGF